MNRVNAVSRSVDFACMLALFVSPLFVLAQEVSPAVDDKVFEPIPIDELTAEKAKLVDTDGVVEAAFVKDFALDGNPDKSVWRKAVPVPEMKVRKGKALPELKTEARVLYSSKALYITAKLFQPMDQLTAQFDQNDLGIYNDDNFSVFLTLPGKTNPRLVHLAINANGNIYDACDGRTGFSVEGMVLKSVRQDDCWTVELKLPFAGFPMDRPFSGDFIGVRFCRNVEHPSLVASYPALTSNAQNRSSDMAKLVFLAPENAEAPEAEAEAAYRAEIVRTRFYERFEALARRISALSGGVSGCDRSVPIVAEAYAGVCQLRAAFKEFEARNADALAKRAIVPEAERQALFAVENGFNKFAADKAYLIWPAELWAQGTPEDRPPVDYSAVTNLVFEQSGNEREAIGLNLQGLLCGPRLDIRFVTHGAWRRKQGNIYPNQFEIYEEKLLRYDGKLISGPLVRVAGNFVTLSPGVTTRIWIVFDSAQTGAGTYRTTLDIKPAWAKSIPPAELGVTVKVWNFALPETRDWPLKSFFWGPNQFQDDEVETLRLMHSHHVTHGWTKGFKYWFGLGPNGRVLGKDSNSFKRELAESANDEFFREAKKLGMRFVIGWNTPLCTEWFDVMTERFLDMGFQYEDFVYKSMIADEFGKKSIPTCAQQRAAVTERFGTNLWFQAVYLSTPPPSGATIEDIEEAKLPEFFKMWTIIGGLAADPKRGPDVIRRLRAKGCHVWDYHCGLHMYGRSALGYYRYSPRKAWSLGMDGTAMWTSCSPHGDDGYDASDGPDNGVLWPGPDGKLAPSKNFEAYREGLEDVAYHARLQKELKRLAEKGLSFPQYEKLIAEFHTQTENLVQFEVDAWRLATGRAIDELCGK